MVTIKDVAECAKVSMATVSRVINNAYNVNPEIKERVKAAIQELGYTPNNAARVLAKRKTNAIGVIVNNLHDPFFYDLIKGFEQGAAETSYSVIFCSTLGGNAADKERYVSYLSSGVTDGIVLYGSYITDEKIIKRLAETNSVFILIENDIQGIEAHKLLIDNVNGAESAVDYLVSLGHKAIAHISGNPNKKVTVDRFNGYLNSMHKHSLTIEDGYIQYTTTDYKSGYDMMRNLMNAEHRPTAVFCSDDAIASYAIRAAQDMGLTVPADVSVMGFDNQKLLPDGYRGPGITSMEQPLYEIGLDSIRTLTDLLNKGDEDDEKVRKIYSTRIILKDSVAAPNHGNGGHI